MIPALGGGGRVKEGEFKVIVSCRESLRTALASRAPVLNTLELVRRLSREEWLLPSTEYKPQERTEQ